MKAKLINEIVRGKESGIAALGIGKAAIFDPLLDMMKELDGDKFWITWGDTNEPPSECEYAIIYEEGLYLHSLKLVEDGCDEDDVWMTFMMNSNNVLYKHGNGTTLYNNPIEFFKLFPTKENIVNDFQFSMEELLDEGGFKIYKD